MGIIECPLISCPAILRFHFGREETKYTKKMLKGAKITQFNSKIPLTPCVL